MLIKRPEHRVEPSKSAEGHQVGKSYDDRRYRKWDINQSCKNLFAPEGKLREQPCGADSEYRIHYNRNAGCKQRHK